MNNTIELSFGKKIILKGAFMRETYSEPYNTVEIENYPIGEGPGEERNNQILKFCRSFFGIREGYYINLPEDYVMNNLFLPSYFSIFWLKSEYNEIGDWSELVLTLFSNKLDLITDLEYIKKVVNDINWEQSAEKFEF